MQSNTEQNRSSLKNKSDFIPPPFSPNPNKGWVLFAMCAALSLTTLDHTGLAVILPSIQRELNLTNINTQWIMNSYLLTLSALLLFGGTASDKLGHRRTFLAGITLFITSSITCSLAYNGSVLLIARAIQGIGAAFMVPTTSAIIVKSFPPSERPTAIGIYIASSGIFLSAGPLLGGLLTQYISWRALFWINCPLGLTSILLTLLFVPKQTAQRSKWSPDWLGLGLSILFSSGFVLCFMMGSQWGWRSQKIILILVASFIAFIGFLAWEQRIKDPLLNLQLFKNKSFSLAAMVILYNQTINIVFIFWAHFLQKICQWSPVSSGLALLPITLPIVIISPLGKLLTNRFGFKKLMLFSNVCIILSLFYIGSVAFLQEYSVLFPGFVLFGICMPSIMQATRTVFLSSIELKYQGTAGAISGYARHIGALLGLSLFTAIFNGVYHGQLHHKLPYIDKSLIHLNTTERENLINQNSEAIYTTTSEKDSLLTINTQKQVVKLAVDTYIMAFKWVVWAAAALAVLSSFPIFKLIQQQMLIPLNPLKKNETDGST